MTALGTILGVVLFVWGIKGLYRAYLRADCSPPASSRIGGQTDLDRLRERFATSDMSVEDFERGVEQALKPARPKSKPCMDPSCTQYVEVHVFGDPRGHHLHLHLP